MTHKVQGAENKPTVSSEIDREQDFHLWEEVALGSAWGLPLEQPLWGKKSYSDWGQQGGMLLDKCLMWKEQLDQGRGGSPTVSSSETQYSRQPCMYFTLFPCLCIFIFSFSVFNSLFDMVHLLSIIVFRSVVTRKITVRGVFVKRHEAFFLDSV
jgi:hypothetical protein